MKLKLKRHIRGLANNTIAIPVGNNFLGNFEQYSGFRMQIEGVGNTIEIDPTARIVNCSITMYGNNHRLYIGPNSSVASTSFWYSDDSGSIVIASECDLQGGAFAVLEQTSIKIGDKCLFSYGVDFRTSDSHSIVDQKTGERLNKGKSIEIGEHVWLGKGVTVLKGVSIGNNSVVGIGSIVTKSAPANSLLVGAPAKVVREGVDWVNERI